LQNIEQTKRINWHYTDWLQMFYVTHYLTYICKLKYVAKLMKPVSVCYR